MISFESVERVLISLPQLHRAVGDAHNDHRRLGDGSRPREAQGLGGGAGVGQPERVAARAHASDRAREAGDETKGLMRWRSEVARFRRQRLQGEKRCGLSCARWIRLCSSSAIADGIGQSEDRVSYGESKKCVQVQFVLQTAIKK